MLGRLLRHGVEARRQPCRGRRGLLGLLAELVPETQELRGLIARALLGVASVASGLRKSRLNLLGPFAVLSCLRGSDLDTGLELGNGGGGLVGVSLQLSTEALDLGGTLGRDPVRLSGGLAGALCLVALMIELGRALRRSSLGSRRRGLCLLEM